MLSFFQRRGVRAARTAFRWCRITLWFAILLVLGALAYLHLVGLPDFLKPPLVQLAMERGFDARFASAHLTWGPAIFIENAGFSPTNRSAGPRLSAGVAEVKLNWAALLHFKLKADSVEMLNGQVRIPVSEKYGKSVILDRVHVNLRLFSNDVAQVNDFRAIYRGVRIRIDGEVTNFASMSDWKLPARWEGKAEATNATNPPQYTNILEQFQFGRDSSADIYFSADGHDINTLRADGVLNFPTMETPWATASGLQLRAAAAHLLDTTNRPFMQAHVTTDNISTRWGSGANMSLTAAFYPDSSTPFNASLDFEASDVEQQWTTTNGPNFVHARLLRWDGIAALTTAHFKPEGLNGTLRAEGAESTWGKADSLSFTLKADRANSLIPLSTNWGFWAKFAPYVLSSRIAATNLQASRLRLDSVELQANWDAPELTISNLQSRLYAGGIDASADLNVDSRLLRLHAATDFDPQAISQFLTPAAQLWISQLAWQKPPAVKANISVTVPPWTNRTEEWRNDVRSSIQMAGDFKVGAASFRKIEVAGASAQFSYSNRVWNVPRLHAIRTDGSVDAEYTGNDATHEFHIVFDSHLDPDDAAPWLKPSQQEILSEFHFSQPPDIHGEARGVWHDLEAASIAGTIVASNFTARGEHIDAFRTGLDYTNHLLRVSGLGLSQGPGRLDIPSASANFSSKRFILTNAQSTLDPRLVAVVMATNTPGFLQLLRFATSPQVRASGAFVVGDPSQTDLHLEVQGGHFHWTNLSADSFSATVLWRAKSIIVTNVQARLYNDGKLRGWVAFDHPPKQDVGFRTDFTINDIDLGQLAREIAGKTNRVEGRLEGSLTLEAPIAEDKDTWTGHGYVHIHNALLWDIKMFGVLSPLLNAMSPGLGDSRAREATAPFNITDGKVFSDNLEIHSTGVRLLYRGSISMKKQINGRVEADMLRDTPLFGTVMSVVMTPLGKLFEYQITGPLTQPTFKPLYVPKFLMLFLRPFHTLKTLLPEDKPGAPPATPPADTKPNTK
ncbi:MAG TPA: hypothetical protein VGO67_10295 [Verrucomicrobiae bacterium]|jgi:hypothetical protein